MHACTYTRTFGSFDLWLLVFNWFDFINYGFLNFVWSDSLEMAHSDRLGLKQHDFIYVHARMWIDRVVTVSDSESKRSGFESCDRLGHFYPW